MPGSTCSSRCRVRPRRRTPTAPGGWLPVVADDETMAYFDALAEELPAAALPGDPAALQVRALHEVQVDTSRRAHVETFVGARLGTWAAGCIASPYGVLFTRVDHWPTTTMQAPNGTSFQVAALDESPPTAATFTERLDALVADRDIEVLSDHPLQRIVFEEGRIVGVVLDSADGPWAVRARVGIAVTSQQPVPPDTRILDGDSRIALVGLTASRFGRVEVLGTADVPAPAESTSG
ncbi:MAG: hypothetical protein U5N53_34210 [Mycobacterium sp.]|nr:hypothetical protein [Mycobacterium sp.]